MARSGDSVEWFGASFAGAAPEETIDGVHVVRGGRQWSVHWAAYRRYRGNLAGNFDVIVDEVNTIPFFTPWWSDIPVVMLIHQLAREVWWYESPFPVSALGFIAEPLYLKGYRRVPVLTVSLSTKSDLEGLGFQGSITLVPEGIEPSTRVARAKPAEPSFLYVGRIAASKRIEHIVEAFASFRRLTGTGSLRLVGAGSERYQRSLMRLARSLGVWEQTAFLGKLSTTDKQTMMAQSHVLLMTSVREGWGLVVTEAARHGTPAIVYDVPGLRDSVRNESTGLVVKPEPQELSKAMLRLTSDAALYSRLAAAGQKWSETFSYSRTSKAVRRALKSVATPHEANNSDAQTVEAPSREVGL